MENMQSVWIFCWFFNSSSFELKLSVEIFSKWDQKEKKSLWLNWMLSRFDCSFAVVRSNEPHIGTRLVICILLQNAQISESFDPHREW